MCSPEYHHHVQWHLVQAWWWVLMFWERIDTQYFPMNRDTNIEDWLRHFLQPLHLSETLLLFSYTLQYDSCLIICLFVRSFCLCKFKLRLPSQWKHIYRSSSFHLLSSAGWSISKYMLKRQLFGILVCVSVNICLLWHESDQSKCLLSHYPEWHPIITS